MLRQWRNGTGVAGDYESMNMNAPVHVSLQISEICVLNMRFSVMKESPCFCPVGGRALLNEPSDSGH